MSRPVLTIIAGPNGAGKSTLSDMMVEPGTFIFDGDRELAELQKRFSETDSSTLMETVNETIFTQRKQMAIVHDQDFAMETNFASADPMKTVEQFRRAGYGISMIFVGLPNSMQAIKRVNLRVRKGGHRVSVEDIKSNYREGLSNMKSFMKDFDSVTLIHNGIVKDKPIDLVIVANLKRGKVINIVENTPKWALNILPDKGRKQSLLPKKRLRRGKGLGL
jgi:predicted ABC-type ATPase